MNDAKDEFLGLVSHELRTPITTVLGNAAVLRRRGGLLPSDLRRGAVDDIVARPRRNSRGRRAVACSRAATHRS